MTLREKLIVLRDKAGISQMTLAHQLGVCPGRRFLAGKAGMQRHQWTS